MKAPPLLLENLKDPYFRPWGDLQTRCYDRQSTMHKVGNVSLCLSIGFGVATITGALVVSYCVFPYMTMTITISVVGSMGTIFLVGFGIYLLKKDYWNDDAFRLAKRAIILDAFQNEGYKGLAGHRINIYRYSLLATDEEQSLILKCNIISCSSFVKDHGFGPLSDGHINANTEFDNGKTLRGLFLTETVDNNFNRIFSLFGASNFWTLFTFNIAQIEDVRDKALNLFTPTSFPLIINAYGWNLFDYNIVSYEDECVQTSFNHYLYDVDILKFLRDFYKNCHEHYLIPEIYGNILAALKAQYSKVLFQERDALEGIERKHNQQLSELRSQESEQLGLIDSQISILRLATSARSYPSHSTKHYPRFQERERYDYHSTSTVIINHAEISRLEAQKRDIESKFESRRQEARSARSEAESRVTAIREDGEKEIVDLWNKFKRENPQNYIPSAPTYDI